LRPVATLEKPVEPVALDGEAASLVERKRLIEALQQLGQGPCG
jgi:hypothetical protein